MRNYVETSYGITGSLKIDDSLAVEFERYKFNPVKDYLRGLKWDGTKRIDTLLIDYFGAIDNEYTREGIRKMLTGAVARIYEPGVKFDYVLTLVSEEGTGKSTFVKKLGRSWFSDTFISAHGKESFEQIQGAWIIEIAELAGLRKSDIESVKHFITKQEDSFRPAYGRTVETYKRQCVFFGTTNDKSFLKDPGGNRRFLPVEVRPEYVAKDLFSREFDAVIDQIWAEAVELYKQGEDLFLSRGANSLAVSTRKLYTETDDRAGLVEEFLNAKLPENWYDRNKEEKALFFAMSEEAPKKAIKRQAICAPEIWCECFGKDLKDMTKQNTREINAIMRSLDDWKYINSTKSFNGYGKQRYYKLIEGEI